MPADNWTTCPACRKGAQARRFAIDGLYGKIPIEEWVKQRQEATEYVGAETLREDYEVYGIKDGTIHFEYSANCAECGFSADIKQEWVALRDSS